ncbi:hypothetical protein ABW21_db0206900 [Orbilia brochopaga]|nr:hypothetical protein ABW21_db0206900 [Drechslerella brochopaga]
MGDQGGEPVKVEITAPVSGVLQDENSVTHSEPVEPQDQNLSEVSGYKSTSNVSGEMGILDHQHAPESVTPELEHSMNTNDMDESEAEYSDLNSILHNIYDAEQVEPSPLPSPDFSDPQIVTSTPDQNNSLHGPATAAHDILTSENHQTGSAAHEILISENNQTAPTEADSIEATSTKSNNLTKSPARVMQEIDGNRQVPPSKHQVTSDKKMELSETVNEFNADNNKENIAPEEDDQSDPTTVHLGDRAMSLSSLSRIAHSEANDDIPALGHGEETASRWHGAWPKRPLRMVRSAIDSIRVRGAEGSASQEKRRKRPRPSVRELFKFARSYKAVEESDLGGTPSFRVLPTIDCPSTEPEAFPRKTKSSLSVRLDRKKKPILAVPKMQQQRSSFIVHSEPNSKPTTPRKTSYTSRKSFASRIARRFNMKILPLFRRRVFSAPSVSETLEEEEPIRFQRTPSPPPRLELELPRSGL